MLHHDYKDMLLCLNNHEAEYVAIGAHTMAVHGSLRDNIKISYVYASLVLILALVGGGPMGGCSGGDGGAGKDAVLGDNLVGDGVWDGEDEMSRPSPRGMLW